MQIYITNCGIINLHCQQFNSNSIDHSQNFITKINQENHSQKKLMEIEPMTIDPLKAMEITPNEVQQMKKFLNTLSQFSEQSKSILTATTLPEILPIGEYEIDLLKKWSNKTHYQIIYRATKDGLNKRTLMKKCAGHKNVYFLMKYDGDNVFAMYYGNTIPQQPSAGPAFLDATNHFLALLKHSSGITPFTMKRFNITDRTFIVGASDEYVDRVIACVGFLYTRSNFSYYFGDTTLYYYCVEDRSFNFKNYFPREGYFNEFVAVEMS
ncbi:hypothetical protein EHI8A_089640 [Entamoeba histolytica HM-1:IMSS-B]|uniref:TLDc domain-containing protein n=5 Tax=Entamoeba histolytica TaxID=5759 RepID=C4MA04_ENTH1|nr:hypothetical protein EHI_144740 [Entamoeba histolytica HM-1:IMSS]EMH73355.1 hypothetical protein EHI8A_089640 [Entamoeba histolytica HM-1:IMSS-B]EMS13866.1 hypothetical protein KM1_159470 [Entamoeba histolytica HM-3:IMSS]ENY61328.1 hypothetical protein EHI7A_087920 [Entamoeba histolytica HM-1:IMSS-A]GAT98573.1 hypothetical protein CL6EHI_144740 [Entamoeba histolytica]EAL46623.1 hypothetical protein EHI_144740 [Entamoeba histolytica HM-1:IMSS]|eukprot:XP_652011.1 hypothetical protein EHI_144740 [Entamoeba histolytica HM-1:IMSS]